MSQLNELKKEQAKVKPVVSEVRCPGCKHRLRFPDEQVADDAIEEHTAYGCQHPDPIVQARLSKTQLTEMQAQRKEQPRRRGRNERTPKQ